MRVRALFATMGIVAAPSVGVPQDDETETVIIADYRLSEPIRVSDASSYASGYEEAFIAARMHLEELGYDPDEFSVSFYCGGGFCFFEVYPTKLENDRVDRCPLEYCASMVYEMDEHVLDVEVQ